MKVALASDHRGFKFKNVVGKHLSDTGHERVDIRTKDGKDSVDYAKYRHQAAKALSSER
ncbi:MAG: ribose 5-phosphate isomerase B, partial [Gammaproteobacteria bacterium]|nr:ribose 5-phosphate isomerase B [Gammaproteobacteria bacterium]